MLTPPLINLLIRVHRRENLLRRCVDSIRGQDYKNWKIIASYHDEEDLQLCYENGITDVVQVFKDDTKECFFNLYINDLKAQVKTGFFQIIDSDNYLFPNSLSKLAEHLTDPDTAYVVQFERCGRTKPNETFMRRKEIRSGQCDASNLVLHSKHKEIAMVEGWDNSDYKWVKEVTERLQTKFLPLKVVGTDRRSRGSDNDLEN